MCDPLTIAGIALTGASTVANSIGAAKANKAREGAMAAERIRQQGLDREADALNVQSQNRYLDFEGQQDDRSAELTDYFEAQASPLDTVNASAALPPSSSNITVVEEGRQRQKARDFTNTQAASLGQLRSFGDLVGSIGRDQARDAMKIGQIGGFKRGSASIIPHELEAAASKGAGYRFLGDVFGGAGGVAFSAARNPDVLANTIPGSLEIKFGADPWRGLRTTGDKSFLKAVRLGPTYGQSGPIG